MLLGGLLAVMQAGWLADWVTGCVLPGWWCIVATCCSGTQKSASPSILAHFSSHGYQKVLEFTGGLKNAARIVVKCTKSTTPINPRTNMTYKTWLLVLLLAWLQHFLECPWPASASIIQRGRCADQSKKVITYFQMLVACWLAGWLADWPMYCLAGGASCQLAAHARKRVPLHQYWPVSQATGIKKY